MLENFLKELGEQGYEIYWQFDDRRNELIVKIRKDGYQFNQLIDFNKINPHISSLFEFDMIGLLKCIIKKMEKDMKGEN